MIIFGVALRVDTESYPTKVGTSRMWNFEVRATHPGQKIWGRLHYSLVVGWVGVRLTKVLTVNRDVQNNTHLQR